MGGIGVFVVVMAAVLLWHERQRQAINKSWSIAASALGLDFQPVGWVGNPSMRGYINDMAVVVEVYTSGGGNSRHHFTRYRVKHTPVGPPVKLKKQGSFSFMGALVGRRDVEIGDPFFDDRVVVDSRSPDSIRAFLTPTRRSAVLDLLSVWPGGEFTHESLEISARGREANSNRIQSTVYRLLDTAIVMGDGSIDHILEHQQQGQLGQSAQELHELNQTRSNVFSEILEAEVLVELGRHEEAAALFDQLGQRLPEDPSIPHWQDLSHLPPPPAPPAELPEPARIEAPVTLDLTQQAVVDDLFAANRMSWEIVEYFEATYQNAVIDWTGEVTQFHTYRHDSDFGSGPGVKATVLLGRAGASDFISNEVHAIVQLPAGADVVRGGVVRVRGLLTHVDRFSRKVFIERAEPIV